jgi:hypothetical protein
VTRGVTTGGAMSKFLYRGVKAQNFMFLKRLKVLHNMPPAVIMTSDKRKANPE